jgi:hypothetical protein
MYIVIVNEGSLTIPSYGHALNQIGVLTKSDVLEAKRNPFIDYEDIQEINGGNFLSGLKKFGQKLAHAVKVSAPYVKKAYEIGKKVYPYAKTGFDIARTIAPYLAAGEGQVVGEGEGVRAGAAMSRRDLRSRMRRL